MNIESANCVFAEERNKYILLTFYINAFIVFRNLQ